MIVVTKLGDLGLEGRSNNMNLLNKDSLVLLIIIYV